MPARSAGLRLVLFGAPGVGKGTQAAEIRRRVGVPHISTGEMLREAMARGTPLGERVREAIERGGLVPDDIVDALVEERLGRPDAQDGFLLDGFPRTPAQADQLDAILARLGLRLDGVVNLAVGEEEIVDRLSGRRVCGSCGALYHVRNRPPRQAERCDACGGALRRRADDAPEAIAERMRVYRAQTAPLVERYERAGLLRTVDGGGRPEEVFERIAALLPVLQE